MTAPSIVTIYPANGSLGFILSDSIYVIFDREVDTSTVQIVVESPDTDRWSGPDMVRWDSIADDSDDDVLATPGYHGIVAGVLTFERIDSEGNVISDEEYNDPSGNGGLWRTKAIFTPTYPLSATTEYTVYVIGDEDGTDDVQSGVSSRTIFDTVKGANIGDGEVYFTGGYTGTNTDKITVRLIETGDAADGIDFEWWKDTNPTVVREGEVRLNSQFLVDDISIRFSGDFTADDEFSIVVVPAERMEDTTTWAFTTGSGSIIDVPDDVTQLPSTPIGGVVGGVSGVAGSTYLQVTTTSPINRGTNLETDTLDTITVTFSENLDATTVTEETVTVWAEPVNGIFSDNPVVFSDPLDIVLTIEDNVLTIEIDTDTTPLYDNNAVFVKLDASIASEDLTLEEDYEFYFTTTYDPLYQSVRRIRLDLGVIVRDIPDDTINLAIFEASLEANALVFGVVSTDNLEFFEFARRQFVTCMAELILLNALSGSGTLSGSQSKRLADLDVSHNGAGGKVGDLLDRAIACRIKWEAILTSSGELGLGTSQRPSMVIKGRLDPDRPHFGRDWEPTSTFDSSSYPAANGKSRDRGHRRWKSSFGDRWNSRFWRR